MSRPEGKGVEDDVGISVGTSPGDNGLNKDFVSLVLQENRNE